MFGLRIYGSPWCHWKPANNPGGRGHLFDRVPEGTDVLMTHGPPRRIFDTIGYTKKTGQMQCVCRWGWGSSQDLNDAIIRARPRVHLFGHAHEQRGWFQRISTGEYIGGVEYEANPGHGVFPTESKPPQDWPCDVVSCNAMSNHCGHEKTQRNFIAGPPRRILATRNSDEEPWKFSVMESRKRKRELYLD